MASTAYSSGGTVTVQGLAGASGWGIRGIKRCEGLQGRVDGRRAAAISSKKIPSVLHAASCSIFVTPAPRAARITASWTLQHGIRATLISLDVGAVVRQRCDTQ